MRWWDGGSGNGSMVVDGRWYGVGARVGSVLSVGEGRKPSKATLRRCDGMGTA